MPNQVFESQYYKVISKIAQKAVKSRDYTNEGWFMDTTADAGKYNDEELALQDLKEEAKKLDIEGFTFDFKADSILAKKNKEIFDFFHNIDSGEPCGDGVDTLEIPEINKQEIQVQGFVNAFDKMKEKGSDDDFSKFYNNVRTLSLRTKLLEVENPELSQRLSKSNAIFDSFDSVYFKVENKSELKVGDMLDKAEKAYEIQQEMKSKLAEHIALNGIPVFDENGEISKQFKDLEAGNIFEGESLDGDIKNYLNQDFKDLIEQQSEIVKLDKVFNALGMNSERSVNMSSFKELIDAERVKIDEKKILEAKKDTEVSKKQGIEKQSTKLGRTDSDIKLPINPKLNSLKEQIARNILAVAKVEPAMIDKIMNNPEMANAKEAIMKRAENALKNLGVDTQNEFGLTTKLNSIVDKSLQNQIEKQSKELVAQVGRVSSRSIDGQDMRGKENLHEKYQDKANKLDKGTFNKNVVEALNYEKTKDDRGKIGTLAYNTFFRKPLQLLDAMRPVNDKPFFTPGKTAIAGLVALAVLAPPLGAIVGIALMCKAAKNQLYDGTKLQSWVNDKFFKKPPEKESIIDKGALEKVNVKSLLPEKVQDLEKITTKDMVPEKVQDLDKTANLINTNINKGQGDKMVEKSAEISKDKFEKMLDSKPELRDEMKEIINKAKVMVGKDKGDKQRSMDDLDLMSVKSRLASDTKKHKSSGNIMR